MKKETERNMPVAEEKRQTLRQLLHYLEAALGDKPYFLGDLSLTDFDLMPRYLRMDDYSVLPSPSLPKLTAWLQRMKQRRSVKAVL